MFYDQQFIVPLISMYLLAVIFGISYRAIARRIAKGTVRGLNRNIGTKDRVARVVIGIVLLFAALKTQSLLLFFFSGFAFFEAFFSWCGLYAALGKSTCPVE